MAALLLLAACEKQSGGGPGEGLPMGVEATLAGAKASITTDDLQTFWLQVDCSSDAAYSYCVPVSKSVTGWSADRQLLWKSETAATTYCAAFFGGHDFTRAEFASGVDLTIPANQSTQAGLNAADLLTLKATSTTYESTTGGVLPVALNHGLAKVIIELSLGSDFYDNHYGRTTNPVTAFTVIGSNLGFHFQPATGAVSVKASTGAAISPMPLSYTPGTATAKTSVATYEVILVPQTFAAGTLSVSFKVDTKSYVWTNAEAITLTAGQTVNLPVSVTVAPPAAINGHAFVDMGEVTIGGVTKNLLWATCNIGANDPWDYGDYYAWGATTTQTIFDWANYPLMQTDQSDWKHITKYTFADGKTSAIWYDGGNFIGDGKTSFADYDYADDAARQIWGGGWRIPTDEEWTALLNTTNYSWVWTTNYNGSGKNGMLVTRLDNSTGTDPCAGNSIFLPAASYRSSDFLSNAGSEGCYWSSSLNMEGVYNAWYVRFDSGRVYNNFGGRYYGQSLRPVTEK